MCIIINYFISFNEYLLFIQSSERGLFEAGYFAANVYNALQFILVFLTDVPKPTYKRKCQNTMYTIFIKHGQNGAISVNRAKFSEAVKTLLAFLVCDTAVASHFNLLLIVVPRYLYSSTTSTLLSWMTVSDWGGGSFLKSMHMSLVFLRSDTNTIYHTMQQSSLK